MFPNGWVVRLDPSTEELSFFPRRLLDRARFCWRLGRSDEALRQAAAPVWCEAVLIDALGTAWQRRLDLLEAPERVLPLNVCRGIAGGFDTELRIDVLVRGRANCLRHVEGVRCRQALNNPFGVRHPLAETGMLN